MGFIYTHAPMLWESDKNVEAQTTLNKGVEGDKILSFSRGANSFLPVLALQSVSCDIHP